MVTYVVLAKFTDQGAKTAKRLPRSGQKRSNKWRKRLE